MKTAAAANLKAVALYGSSVAGGFHAKHSTVNLLCLVERSDLASLDALRPVMEWWTRQGHAAPLVFTLEELRRSADVFAIELLDMKAHHRMLHGSDFFGEISVPLRYHRLQVERELRTNWLKFRQHLLVLPPKREAQLELMLASVSSFATLFRHALIALGEPPAANKRDAVARAAAQCGASPAGFDAILDVREGKLAAGDVDAEKTVRAYFALLEAMTNEVDRRLEEQA